MRKIIKNANVGLLMLISTMQVKMNVLASGTDVQGKITNAANTVKGILTGIVAIMAICVSLFIIIKRMPDADNPHEKHELYRGVGRVWGLVALAAACIWVIPWIYGLFT